MRIEIKDLKTSINNKEILKNFDLTINDGEVHAIMGVGKSTLSRVIMGDKNYQVLEGEIKVDGQSILNLKTDERSRLGIFLAFQNPLEIDGVSNQDFLKTALSANIGKNVGLYDFIKRVEVGVDELKMNKELIHRSLNSGFSGGEKKKNEILMMKLLKPKFIILDELDSGLDVDSLQVVCENILSYIKENKETSLLIITHYPRILEYLKPQFVHVLMNGSIVKTSNMELANLIEKEGYQKVLEDKTSVINEGKPNE